MKLVWYNCLIIALFVLFGCDKIDPPFKQQTQNPTDTNTYFQKVLIEDFTGHRCGNCPRAHEKLNELKSLYGNKIIGMAIHSGFFAMPLPPNYPADYRTSEGDEITNSFGVTQYPSGMVNRKPYNGNLLLSHDSWSEAVNELIQQQPALGIRIQNTFQTNNVLTSTISIKILQPISETAKLCLFITEDSIISPQTDYNQNPTLIPNYVHMHMLRASINGTWGNDIPINTKNVGDTILRNFSFNWNNNWQKKHSHVVAFVYKTTNNEIIQVEEAKVQ
ncbi:MAG: Omp28 family outer membrane lipoprotein [Bacteroidales bacterium]|nr:Omp28 family outer membrane lipoprotein [Bacteroidales bacterium]